MHRTSQILKIAALFACLAAPSWGQSGLLRGEVVDAEGNPVPGVKITITSGELSSFRKTLTTDKDGEFKIRFQKTHGQYLFDFLFEKPGFQSFTQPISPSVVDQVRERLVMEKAVTRVVESHGDLSSVVTGSTNLAIEAFNAGVTAQRAGDLPTAKQKLEEAIASDPELTPAHVALGQVLLDQGEHAAAVEAADRALAKSASSVDALDVKYKALRALGRDDEADAVEAALAAAEDAVASALRLYNEGGQAFQAGDHETALASFRHAAELDPSLTDAHHAVATLELEKGNLEASAEAAEKALALGSEDVRTLRVLFNAYEALGRIAELAEIAPRLAAVDPEFGGSKLAEQAAEQWNAGQAAKAVSLAQAALAVDPQLAKPYYFLGLDHLSRGENAEARAALQKFIELAPDDPEAGTASEMLAYIE
ncbi:MAG: tetratricopeptide repeat protein [Acidobacteriota bacterium]|nr:tetratricopeptide repeat protein [Acidobacteriota bacterium]